MAAGLSEVPTPLSPRLWPEVLRPTGQKSFTGSGGARSRPLKLPGAVDLSTVVVNKPPMLHGRVDGNSPIHDLARQQVNVGN